MTDRPHIFGWCNDGHCRNCRGEVVTFYVDEKGVPHTTGSRTCEHHCHGEAA